MPIDKSMLVDFLRVLGSELGRKITLVAAGGTAMTLLGIKPSTIDIDFTIPRRDIGEFEDVLKRVPHGFKIDYWADGMVFSQVLPPDYLERSRPIRTRPSIPNIGLRALHPADIVVTKIGRLNSRDLEDIESCIKQFNLTRNEIRERAEEVTYVGNEENYRINLRYVLGRFFGKGS